MKLRLRLVFLAATTVVAMILGPVPAFAYPANGSLVGTVHFSHTCPDAGGHAGGISVGVAFDGTNLWYTCFDSGTEPDLLRADPKTGLFSATYNIDGGLGALAFDVTRNALWAAPGGPNLGAIWLIKLDAAENVMSSAIQFNAGADAGSLDDGIAFDAADDTLYFKPDVGPVIHHYTTAGVKLADLAAAASCMGTATSGLAIGGNLLFEGKNGCAHVYVVDKKTLAPAFDFSTIVAGDSTFRDEGLSCDNVTFAPVDVMWSKEAYAPMRAAAFAIPKGTCGVGGDSAINPAGTSISSVEGQSVTASVATFSDPDTSAPASEYSAVIDWGDASTSAGIITGAAGSFSVSGTHTYAEEGSYKVTVTVTDVDNPKSTGTANSTATVVDAALAASPACSATSLQKYNAPTATFTDAASPFGTLSDFTASINWGDASVTAGTVSGPDGGPYTVSGSHTFATTGTFTITTTIKDVGGAQAVTSCKTLGFAFAPGGGAFVIGDQNSAIGTPVTFWGAQWAKTNSLSGGAAPRSFKGFAKSPTTPTCGATFTAAPGNSSPPPAGPLPTFMAVIVTSKATKSGSTTSGTIVHIVIVKTNPGYSTNPGHAGTGTVVAVVC
jgi:hypothetical protein